MFRSVLGLVLVAAWIAVASAQVIAPGQGVSMGHLHLNSSDPEAQKKLWVDVLGATPAKLGDLDVFQISGALVLVNKSAPAGPSDGSVVNHVGVKVKDMEAVLAKVEAAGIKIVSRNPKQAMLLASDGLRVELTADPELPTAIANHHIHFYTPDVDATKRWYVATFGAKPGQRGPFEAADLPGVNLTFAKSETALAGTKGRVLDHIGFEVANLEAFTKKLEASGVKVDVPYRKLPRLGIALAFFTDPWGVYIELTEGLAQVSK